MKNTLLVQEAADLEAKGWSVSWDEDEAFFKAFHLSLSNGEIVVCVINGNLFIELM